MLTFPEIAKSRPRRKLLSYFFTNPEADLYIREAAAILKEDPANLSKELLRLQEMGVFNCHQRGKEKYFLLNKQYPLYTELKSVVSKTIGVKGSLQELFGSLKGIKAAFIYGSFAQQKEGASSDIDILIIGSPDKDKLMEKIDRLESRLRREINYNVYPEKEFKKRLKAKDGFLLNILKRPKIILTGSLNGI